MHDRTGGGRGCRRAPLTAALLLALVGLVAGCLPAGGTGDGDDRADGGRTDAPVAGATPSDGAGPSGRPQPPAGRDGERAGERPNVLVIETDDMRPDDLRFMPQVRRLVQQRGLTFANSFAPNPLCCPSRASFLTGQYSHNTGVYTHERPYGFASFRDRRTLATALQAAGYRTGMVGKYLNGYGYQELRRHHGARGDSATYVPPGWTRWMAGVDYGDDALSARLGISGSTYDYDRLSQNVDGRLRTTPGYSAEVMATQVQRMIGGFARRDAPWFVWWTPIAPHHGGPEEPDDPPVLLTAEGKEERLLTAARPDWVKGRADALVPRAPGVRPDGTTEADVSDKPRWMQRPELTPAEREGVRTVARQRAEALLALDREVGRVLTRLDRSPEGRDTYVVLTSDNGYYLGEHRQPQGKGTLLEPSLRVPLLVAGPGVSRGTRYDPASTVDLAPTIAGWTGAVLPAVDGVDLAPTIEGDRGWSRPVVAESRMGFAVPARGPDPGLTMRGLRLGGWSVTGYAKGEVELYDMRADPLQLDNLADDPRHRGDRRRLLGLLATYEDCRGAACAAPLPADLTLSPTEAARVTKRQERETRDYYGRP